MNGSLESCPPRTDVSVTNPLQTIAAIQRRNPSYSIFQPTTKSIKELVKPNPPFRYPQLPKDHGKLRISFTKAKREAGAAKGGSPAKIGPGSYDLPPCVGNLPTYVEVPSPKHAYGDKKE